MPSEIFRHDGEDPIDLLIEVIEREVQGGIIHSRNFEEVTSRYYRIQKQLCDEGERTREDLEKLENAIKNIWQRMSKELHPYSGASQTGEDKYKPND